MLLVSLLTPLAHKGLSLAASWTTPELPVSLGLLLLATLYLCAIGPLRERYGWAPSVERSQVVYFLSAMGLAFVTLQGPLHVLSDGYLLTAHMVQHLLITLVLPPLLLKGLPAWLIDRLLLVPLYLRRAARRQRPGKLTNRLPRGPVLQRIGRAITAPLIAYPAFNVVLLAWHIPKFYDATLTNDTVHSVMHVMFICTAVLTWWPVYSPSAQLPAISEPLQMIYLFFQSIPSTILGAIIALSSVVLYPTYALGPRIGLAVRDDQQVAGLLMWFGGGLFFLALITVRWFHWMGRDDGAVDPTTEPAFEAAQPANPSFVVKR